MYIDEIVTEEILLEGDTSTTVETLVYVEAIYLQGGEDDAA